MALKERRPYQVLTFDHADDADLAAEILLLVSGETHRSYECVDICCAQCVNSRWRIPTGQGKSILLQLRTF